MGTLGNQGETCEAHGNTGVQKAPSPHGPEPSHREQLSFTHAVIKQTSV